ncbi:MAG: DNA polymerase/3'-5' exonuclease PolX [Planctomycetota bacterium]
MSEQSEITNAALALRFEQMAQMLELLGADRFRVNAHAKAARVLGELTTEVRSIVAEASDDKTLRSKLTELDGIGAKTADKIIEFARTGEIEEHGELLEKVPSGLLRVLEVPGLGPKTVKQLWESLGVESVEDLKRVIDDGSILGVPRMGKKTVENISASLRFAADAGRRLPIGLVQPMAERLVEELGEIEGVQRIAFAGSLRRGKETIGDIDLLCVAEDSSKVHEAFRAMEGVRAVPAAGDTKSSVRLAIDQNFGRWRGLEEDGEPTIQVDLRTVPGESWGAALMYFTGSKEHNVRVRERAQKQGLTLNEYGLFEDDGSAEGSPQSRGLAPVSSREEAEIYARLGLAVVPPELREDRGELGLDTLPELVSTDQIRSELHAHTTDSDGHMVLDELVDRARSRGFHTIAVTDHSQSSAVAGGLTPERLREQRRLIEEARKRHEGISILCGSEVDILADGSLDYDDEMLHSLDVIVASPHTSTNMDSAKATARMLRAIEHPMVHVIGHPTGRLINRRKGMEPAMDDLIAAAKEHRVALEINAHWMRLDLRDTHVRAAVDAGCLIAIDCDVHAPEDFDNIRYGVMTGRRGWLPSEQCVNTWGHDRLHGWLKSKR